MLPMFQRFRFFRLHRVFRMYRLKQLCILLLAAATPLSGGAAPSLAAGCAPGGCCGASSATSDLPADAARSCCGETATPCCGNTVENCRCCSNVRSCCGADAASETDDAAHRPCRCASRTPHPIAPERQNEAQHRLAQLLLLSCFDAAAVNVPAVAHEPYTRADGVAPGSPAPLNVLLCVSLT